MFLDFQGLQRFQSGPAGGMGKTWQTLPAPGAQVNISRGKYIDSMHHPTATVVHANMFAPTYVRIAPGRDLDMAINSNGYRAETDIFVHLLNTTFLPSTFLVESQLCSDIHLPPGTVQWFSVYSQSCANIYLMPEHFHHPKRNSTPTSSCSLLPPPRPW